jgi:hypothetical protein
MTKTGWLSGLVLVALSAAPAYADAKKKPAVKAKTPGKDFWKVLVKPNAKWVLTTSDDKSNKVIVETYDVRKVGDADVARVRWTHQYKGGKDDIGSTDSGKFTQVAVTAKGLYLLNKENDDAAVAKRLEGKPSRSSPPKEYKGTKTNGGRYLSINKEAGGVVCMGEGPIGDDAPDCEDVCDAFVCVDESGITELSGLWAPNYDHFTSK